MKSFAFALILLCHVVHAQVSDFANTDFGKADSIAKLFPSHPLRDLRALAAKLTDSLHSDGEKFRAIYRWVCENIEADYSMVMINKKNRSRLSNEQLARWNRKFNAMVYEKLLYERRTVCTGYAYVVRELSRHAGLECEIVNGYAKPNGLTLNDFATINHSWNKVKLNGKWYVCDATWSSGVFDVSTRRFMKRYNDDYFLTDPEKFFEKHREQDSVARN